MKFILASIITVGVLVLPLLLMEGYRRYGARETFRLDSPDGKSVAVVTIKTVSGWALPGPEPAPVLSQEHAFEVRSGRRAIVATPWYNVGTPYSIGYQGLDILWSPDSRRVAHRRGKNLFIANITNGSLQTIRPPRENFCIASFKWTTTDRLVVLARSAYVREMQKPEFPDEADQSMAIELVEHDLASGSSRSLFTHAASSDYRYRSLRHDDHELSPFADRVAFADGNKLCVYDWAAGKLLAEEPTERSINGIRWIDANRVQLWIGPTPLEGSFWELSIIDRKLTKVPN